MIINVEKIGLVEFNADLSITTEGEYGKEVDIYDPDTLNSLWQTLRKSFQIAAARILHNELDNSRCLYVDIKANTDVITNTYECYTVLDIIN